MTFSEALGADGGPEGHPEDSAVLLTNLAGCQGCGLASKATGRALRVAASGQEATVCPRTSGGAPPTPAGSHRGGGPCLDSLPLCRLRGGCPGSEPHESVPALTAGAEQHVQDTPGRGHGDLTMQGPGLGGHRGRSPGPTQPPWDSEDLSVTVR